MHKEIEGIKTKQAQEAGRIETLQALGSRKFNSLPDCLSELTKVIGNVEEIINANHNIFIILENRALMELRTHSKK